MLELDPHDLDRSLRELAARRTRFSRALRAHGDAEEHAFELLPRGLDAELYRTLSEADARDPVAAPAARWLAFLLAEHESIAATRRLARAERLERRPIDAPERGHVSYREVLGRALLDAPKRAAWLALLPELAPSVADARFRLWEEKAEAYARLRRAPVPLEQDTPLVVEFARRFAASTRDVYTELHVGSLSDLVSAGIGGDVRASFPTRISTRSLAELFREGGWLSGLEFRIEDVPDVAGVATFVRALSAFGSAWHDAGASRNRPFVVSHDALGFRAAGFGALFALLPLERAFVERRLDVSRKSAADALRSMARVVLVGARLAALRAELASVAFSGRTPYVNRFLESSEAVLGFELGAELAGALLADDAALVRTAALLWAADRARGLREQHDEDWFRNPRAIAELRAEIETTPELCPRRAELERGQAELTAWLSRCS